MLRRIIIVVITLCAIVSANAQNRMALLVGVSRYPENSGWTRIHANNDLQILTEKLNSEGFNLIICLADKDATFVNIVSALSDLADKAGNGDQVLVHFSCHGQLITDLDGDERFSDGVEPYDQSVIPYDALVSYEYKGSIYHGEKHLTDDILNGLLWKVRHAVGEGGQLVILLDACHSGDADRGGATGPRPGERGISTPFDIPQTVGVEQADEANKMDWITLSACESYQTNEEIDVAGVKFGRLTYAFCQVFQRGMTVEKMKHDIEDYYASIPSGRKKGKQHPRIIFPDRMKQIILFQ